MEGTTPESIQTPVSIPMTSRIIMDCRDFLMLSIISFSSSDHLKPMKSDMMTATQVARKRATWTLSVLATIREYAMIPTVTTRTNSACQNLGWGFRSACCTAFFSSIERLTNLSVCRFFKLAS